MFGAGVDMDSEGLVAAGVAGIAIIVGLAMSSNNDSAEPAAKIAAPAAEPEPEAIDVSIPYDAASLLAYCQAKGVNKVTNQEDYAAFKATYEEAAVAEVTLKKMQRDMAAMEAAAAAKTSALEALKVAP